MSDLCTSEFEDYLWDEFLHGDEQEVSYHSFEQQNECFLRDNRCNKFQSEETGISSDSEYGSVGESKQRRGQDGYSTLSNHESTMLGKGAKRRKHDMISSLDIDDFAEETSGIAYDSSRSSRNGLKSYEGSEFSRNDINSTVNNLEFFVKADFDDYFNDVWPGIANVEDVNSMLRSCDPTFGIGVDKEDEIEFLSLGDDKRECGSSMKSCYNFPCVADSKGAKNIQKNFSNAYLVNDDPLCTEPATPAHGFDGTHGRNGFIPRQSKGVGLHVTVHPKVSVDDISKTKSDGVFSEVKKKFTKVNQSDDITQKADSFWQLQLVTEWLDLKTKLCIRDGLYRLARGVEYRNRHARPSDKLVYESISGGSSYMAKGTNTRNNFVNLEASTNPIDRTIVHLLYHRSLDSSSILNP